MELSEFLRQTHAEVRAEIGERRTDPDNGYPYEESLYERHSVFIMEEGM